MLVKLKNDKTVLFRKLLSADTNKLLQYLEGLSNDTKKRFGPHHFNKEAIDDFYLPNSNNNGYLAIDVSTATIIAYAILKQGYLDHDQPRLQHYGLIPSHTTDCTFAPSVADEWQGIGAGKELLSFILEEMKAYKIRRIILWGGVQCSNHKAIQYYKKNGFKILGELEYNGCNYDMILETENPTYK